MTYVYPVVSRRAGGVSVGINLNPNNACNWACVYCQVPDLRRGTAPDIDLAQLEAELRAMLADILQGDFMQTRVPQGARRLNDIALSGNGEPTSAKAFPQIIELIGRVMADFDLIGTIKLVLITNGSLIDRPRVQDGLRKMAALNGEVWFKFDSATASGMRAINQTRISADKQLARLAGAARLCPTWLQTCVFALDGAPPSVAEQAAYLAAVKQLRHESIPLQGVLLYGLARPSMQPQAGRLSALPAEWLDAFAEAIRQAGLPVKVSP
jgi:wyosine [tRNA(Phe)-imidazoG37] synthetase (radical SAM superfamily)